MKGTERSDYLVGKLAALLERNAGLYDRMIHLLDQETEALRNADLPVIEKGVALKNEVSSQLMALEQERVALLAGLAKEVGAEVDTITLKELAPLHPKREKTLLAIRERLNGLVTVVAQKNELNRGMIEKLISLNTDAATNLAALTRHDTSYGRGAKGSPTPFASGQVVRRTL